MTNDVQIVPTALQYAESFNAAVDAVARERRYIGFIEGPSIEHREFVDASLPARASRCWPSHRLISS